MITNCLECGKAISTKQEHCPYCQIVNEESEMFKQKHHKKSWIMGLLIPLFE